ncbi:MAG: sporulation protein [Ruminococcaceae bacterium]|nr:sporulation protein [Oscillospiraceae bacterium]
MKHKGNLLDKMAYAIDLPGEPLPGQPIVELVGQQRVLIENHRGVVQYGDTEICIRVSYGCVRVCGRDLRLMRMNKEQLIISGCVENVILCKRR